MIRIGTASWTDPTLLACRRFYPDAVSTPEARLRYYASQFPLVEVNTSFYGIGQPRQTNKWVQRTPPDFRFHAKAFRLFTGHQTPVSALGKDLAYDLRLNEPNAKVFYRQLPEVWRDELWRRFLLWLEPLRLQDRLDVVHFQFPPWVRPHPRVQAHVEESVRRLEGFTVALEWRHIDWLTGPQYLRTLDWQREIGVAHTIVDAPQGFDNTAPAVWQTSHDDLSVIRLHGRNAQSWNHATPSSSGRFNYVYSEQELTELARHIRRLADTIKRTHVVFNTNFEDQGMQNARGLQAALAR